MLTAEDFRHELFRILEAAKNSGSEFVEINAGALYRRLGGYPGIDSRMPDCCEVMKAQLAPDDGDVVVNEPITGHGATLTIRYRLPRREWKRAEVPREKSSLEKWNLKLRLWASRLGRSPLASRADSAAPREFAKEGDTSELEMCAYCKKPIQPPDDTVKVSESERVARSFGEPIYQQYAHAKCYKTEIQRQSQRRLKWYGAGPYRAGARGKIRRMACKVMDGLQREFKAAQEKYAQFGYETYRSVRGVSEHKAKQLVREAKEEMAVLRGRMSLHRATCAARKR